MTSLGLWLSEGFISAGSDEGWSEVCNTAGELSDRAAFAEDPLMMIDGDASFASRDFINLFSKFDFFKNKSPLKVSDSAAADRIAVTNSKSICDFFILRAVLSSVLQGT